jgi:hypothetical protein
MAEWVCVRVFPNNFILSMNVRLCFHVDDGENRTLTCPSPSSATSAAVEAVASVWTFTLRMVEKGRCQSHGEEVKLLLTGDCGQGKQGKQGNDPLVLMWRELRKITSGGHSSMP